MIKLFQKFAWCGAELHGLKTGAAGGRVQRTRRIRPTGGSPESGLCGTPRGGHSSPFFWSMGRRWLRPRTPVRSWGFTPNPTTFEKVDETFTCLSRTQARAFELAALSQLRRPKAAFANCPAGSPAGLRNGNEEVGRKPSVSAGLATPPGEGVEGPSPPSKPSTPSCEEVRKPA